MVIQQVSNQNLQHNIQCIQHIINDITRPISNIISLDHIHHREILQEAFKISTLGLSSTVQIYYIAYVQSVPAFSFRDTLRSYMMYHNIILQKCNMVQSEGAKMRAISLFLLFFTNIINGHHIHMLCDIHVHPKGFIMQFLHDGQSMDIVNNIYDDMHGIITQSQNLKHVQYDHLMRCIHGLCPSMQDKSIHIDVIMH